MGAFDRDNYNVTELGVLAVALLGSLNWGLVGVADYNLVTDLIGLSDPAIAYVIVGLAAAVIASDVALETEILDQ